MSKRVLFDSIEAKLLADAPSIQAVQLWNNQLLNETEEEARPYPLVYMELSVINWESMAKGVQKAPVVITLRTVVERYETDDRTFLDVLEEVHGALSLYSVDNVFSALTRLEERQDVDHDNLIVWEVDYATSLIDTTAFTDRDKATVGPVALEVNADLDIDNDVIRTGDGVI